MGICLLSPFFIRTTVKETFMLEFTHIRYGIAIALVAILFGGLLGLSFGCCEDSIKGSLRGSADAVLDKHYSGDANKAVSTIKKSWYCQTLGVSPAKPGGVPMVITCLESISWKSFSAPCD